MRAGSDPPSSLDAGREPIHQLHSCADLDDDFAHLRPALQPAKGLGAPFERHHRVHDRAELACFASRGSSPANSPTVPMVLAEDAPTGYQNSRRMSSFHDAGRWWRRRSPAVRRAQGPERCAPRSPRRPSRPRRRRRPRSVSGLAPGHVLGAWFSVRSAPNARPASSLASEELVTIARAPGCLAICSAAMRHPAADPPDQHRFPGGAAGPGYQHPPGGQRRQGSAARLGPTTGRRATFATFRAGTTRYSAAVPGKCSPSTPNVRQ